MQCRALHLDWRESMKVTSPSLRLACFAIAATVGLALSSSAQAQKVLVDLGQNSSFRGVTVPTPDANGNHWNSVTPGALVTGLVDTTGASTAFNLGWDTPVRTDSFNGASRGATTFPNPT